MLAQIAVQDAKLLGCAPDEVLGRLPKRLSHGVLAWADKTPKQLAIISGGGSLTFAELAAAVEECKAWLGKLAIRPGDRVMLIAENGRGLMAMFLAISEMDAIAAVINARLSDREIDLIAADCDPALIVCTVDDSPESKAHGGRYDCASIHLSVANFDFVTRESAHEPASDDPAELVLAMIYTTGTTGTPKGVMLTHQNLMFIAYVSGKLRGIEAGDEIYCVLPMSHVFGLSAVSSSVLFAGGCVHLVSRFSAAEVLRTLGDEPVKGFLGVPTMYAMMIEAMPAGWSPRALRFIYSGGSPLDPALKQRVETQFGLPLNNGYGLTETGPTICQTRQSAPLANTSVGFCLPGEQIKIIGSDGEPVEPGTVGELWVKGPNVMKGYYRQPEVTAEVIKDGWFNTGDLVFQDDTGAINISGRSKELIIRSGFNIYPPEVEAVLAGFPSVSLCAVLGEAVEGDEQVVAYVQPVAGEIIDKAALLQYAKQYLAGYKVPSRIVIVDSLPTAPSGKILKHQLKSGT
ncbi:MAG: acyl-CoA synthetase (AMP-forming)/AMP-acid ligase II [Candidatus Azotimanducaceae bacterium]|jgi:acyl-CoA synthetase (AMP-forming)/AMP-acid ligase II